MDAGKRMDVGSNFLELIEFTLDRPLSDGSVKTGKYGVHVAKVREVVRMPAINPLVSKIDGVAGVFELRGIPIPAINLAVALGDAPVPVDQTNQIIVAEFSMKRAGFIVKGTQRIRRAAWDKVMPPASDRDTCISGMTLIEDNEFLFILDLEQILYRIESAAGFHDQSAGLFQPSPPNGKTILLVDDSSFILSNASAVLESRGYQVLKSQTGKSAREVLQKMSEEGAPDVDAVVTDVEMPELDGLSLTRWIKGQPSTSNIPVILHTSFTESRNAQAADEVGANAHIVKNDLVSLLAILDRLVVHGGDAAS